MLDTSTVILRGEISDATELPDESMISPITLAELSVGRKAKMAPLAG